MKNMMKMRYIRVIRGIITGFGGIRGLKETVMNTKHIRACLFFIFPFFHFLIFISCGGKPTLADVAEEDSLCIDTVATLDEVAVPDTLAPADSVTADSL